MSGSTQVWQQRSAARVQQARRDQLRVRLFLLAMVPVWAFSFAPTLARAEQAADAKAKGAAKVDALDNEPAKWLRFVDDNKGGGKLEVATGTYKNDDGVSVRPIGAVHIGEKSYYEALSKDFEKYDALLYEMVKPADAGAPQPGMKSKSMVSMFQRFLKDSLELEFQLDGIDYTKKNFVHADLDAETFAKMQDEKGESLLGLMLSQMIRELAKEMEGKGGGAAKNQPDLMELIDAFNSPDAPRRMKLILAKSFGELDEQMSGMQGTVIITERNKKAMSVLRDQIRAGKKNIGVFYGAGHLSDMESRLALMGFKRTNVEWRTAWDMSTNKADGGAEKKVD